VWKDPRTCITLPFWVRALEAKPVAVFVLRHPLEIAASLLARNKFDLELSLALWERYLQHALPHLHGLPVTVVRFEALLNDPVGCSASIAAFLGRHGVAVGPSPDPSAIRAFVEPSLRHHTTEWDRSSSGSLSSSQQALHERLLAAAGDHDRFDAASLPVETVKTDTLFAGLQHRYHLRPRSTGPIRRLEVLRAQYETRRPSASSGVDATLVVITRNEGPALRHTIDRLLQTAPASTELVVVDDGSTDRSIDFLTASHSPIRLVRSSRQLGIARARNLGAREGRGELIVFCDAHLAPAKDWLRPLAEAVRSPGAGAAGPCLASYTKRSVKVYGLSFVDDVLNVRWLPSQRTEPYPVPLLAGCVLAIRREVFNEIGGFDDGMFGYGSEDLELCLRLWRSGLDCLVVPESEVAHRFRGAGTRHIDQELSLFNLLRMGILHLGEQRLIAFLNALRRNAAFPEAMARVLSGDTFRRRAQLGGMMQFDDAWFFERFATPMPGSVESSNGKHREFSHNGAKVRSRGGSDGVPAS